MIFFFAIARLREVPRDCEENKCKNEMHGIVQNENLLGLLCAFFHLPG